MLQELVTSLGEATGPGTMVDAGHSPPASAGAAAYRLSWYMPSVTDTRRASAEAAMCNLSDAELLRILRAAGYLFAQLDGSPAEHVGYLLSYDEGMHDRLTKMLQARAIEPHLVEVTIQFIEQLSEVHRPDLRELYEVRD